MSIHLLISTSLNSTTSHLNYQPSTVREAPAMQVMGRGQILVLLASFSSKSWDGCCSMVELLMLYDNDTLIWFQHFF